VGGGGVLPLVRRTAAAAGQSGIVNALKRKLLDLIEVQGPLTIAQYMAIALGDPEHGYYMRGDPLGRDFTTAPEVSQIFGELIGLFFVQAWEDRRRPQAFQFVELGPGRGTLMADMMRAAGKLRPQFIGGARVTLVETSPTLREAQKKTLGSFAVNWASRFDDIPADGPLFLIANEFFDALPIHQFVKSERGWHERVVAGEGEKLRFMLTPDIVPLSAIPAPVHDAASGSVIEVNPGATELVRSIAGRIAETGGVALIIDYGHTTMAVGDTFQAVNNNAFADPLAEPGEADLSAHVDFAALAAAAAEGGACTPIIAAQGKLLNVLGIDARANRLKRDNPERIHEIDSAVDRLTNPKQMGTMFKALAIFEGMDLPPGFDG
jgi:NADH dehydrogenase [ubiquinone] 1 alpha subcomplex assembly factor 7